MADLLPSDFWKPFSENRWREIGATFNASEIQLKFAVARFNGASQTAAAKMAGYAGEGAALRTAGYAAARSNVVLNILEVAAIEDPVAGKLSPAEVDAKIARMVRSPDLQQAAKGIELHAKREQMRIDAAAEKGVDLDPMVRLKELSQSQPLAPFLLARKHGVGGFDTEAAKAELNTIADEWEKASAVLAH